MTYITLTPYSLDCALEDHSTGKIAVFLVRLTAELAEYIEKKNTDNYRTRDKEKVERYAQYMEEGSWEPGIASIGFSADGVLRNGQHTVSAAAHESVRDLPADKQPLVVLTLGLSEKSGDFFDAPGSSRTAAQQAKNHGHEESAEVSVAQAYLSYEQGHRSQGVARTVQRLQVVQLFEQAEEKGYGNYYSEARKLAAETVYRPRKVRVFKSSNNKYGVAGEVTVDEGNEDGIRTPLTPLVITYMLLAKGGFEESVIRRFFNGLAGNGLHQTLSDPRTALRNKFAEWEKGGAAGSKASFVRLQAMLISFISWYEGRPRTSVISPKMLLPDLPQPTGAEKQLAKRD